MGNLFLDVGVEGAATLWNRKHKRVDFISKQGQYLGSETVQILYTHFGVGVPLPRNMQILLSVLWLLRVVIVDKNV